MTLPLQRSRTPRALFLALLAMACLAGPALAQPDALEAMRARALEAAISGMNLANDPGSDIEYDGQPGDGENKQGLLDLEFFEHRADYHFVLKRRKNPSAAMDSIFRGPTRLECNTMMISIEYRAIRAANGDDRFDRACKNRTVRIEITAARKRRVLGSWLKSVRNPSAETLVPGDWVYFANHEDYLFKHPAGAWQGENALYVGDNEQGEKLFSGFGVHAVTADEMNLELLRAFNAPRNAEDEAWAFKALSTLDKQRVTWLKDNSIIVADSEEEALEIARTNLQLDEDEFDYQVIQDDPGNTLIAIEYTPPTEEYEETIELADVRGLVQCLRLDFNKLKNLGKPRPGEEAPSPTAAATGLSGALGGLGN